MKTLVLSLLLLSPLILATAAPPKHVIVDHEPGRFGGWPANNGAWIWGHEIAVSFVRGWWHDQPDAHSIDRERPAVVVVARSLDGGETWKVEAPVSPLHGTDATNPAPSPGGINFQHPDFALRVRNNAFHFSYDRARTWQGPYALPDLGVGALTARTESGRAHV